MGAVCGAPCRAATSRAAAGPAARRQLEPGRTPPPPRGPRADFADELGQVAAVDPDTFAGELARCLAGQGRPVPQAAPGVQREQIVGLLELAWHELLLPRWSRLQDLLAAGVAVRGTALAAGGLAAVLAELHPQVRLVGASILAGITHTADVALAGRGLTLLPTTWGGGIGAMWDPPWQPALSYPARGTSANQLDLASAGLSQLLGNTRAALLAALTDPASTSGLANRCHVPLSSVSHHLAVLRAAGLTTAHRAGHAVQHHRTDLGDALLSAGAAST